MSDQEAASGARVLLVDDNADAAETLAELLRIVGYEVQVAGDGTAALHAVQSFIPEVALLDIGLPGMDGYELAGRLRADERLAAVKLVALTGYGRDNDRPGASAARFDEHLVKPVGAEQLFDVLERLLAQ